MPFPLTILTSLLFPVGLAPAAQVAGGPWPAWSTRALRADVPHWPAPFDPAMPFAAARASQPVEAEPVVAVVERPGTPPREPDFVFLWPEPPPEAPPSVTERAADLRRLAALDAAAVGSAELGELLADSLALLEALALERGAVVERIELDAAAVEHPRHAHELALAFAARLSALAELEAVQSLPTFASEPKSPGARDTHLVLCLAHETLAALAERRGIQAAQAGTAPASLLPGLLHLHALLDVAGASVTLQDVEAQLARSAEDARALLRRADPAGRYRIVGAGEPQAVPAETLEQRIDLLRGRLSPAPPRLVADEGSVLAAYLASTFLVAEGNELKRSHGFLGPSPWRSAEAARPLAETLARCELLWSQVP